MKQETIFEKRYEHFKELGNALGIRMSYWEQFGDIIELSDNENNGYHGYFGYITPIFNKKKDVKAQAYKFNDKEYSVLIDAVNAVREFSKTLEYPAYTYQPSYRPFFRMRERICWYMEQVLGFKLGKNTYSFKESDEFSRKDLYGVDHYNLKIWYDSEWDSQEEDCCKGKIVYFVGSFQWIESKFSNMDEFIKAINGFVEPFMLIDNSKNLEAMGNIEGLERSYDTTATAIDTSLQLHSQSCLLATKKALECALERINKQIEEAK